MKGKPMTKILLCEDDTHIRKLIATYLSQQGFIILESDNGLSAWTMFQNEKVDVVITDLMMPKMDGFSLTQKIRSAQNDVPILILSALESLEDKEKGFFSGTDDYMVKPIDLKELLMRLKALIRRYQIITEDKIILKSLHLDQANNQCVISGKSIELTKKELQLLFKLLSYPNIIFTREQLMNDIWGSDSLSYDRTVDTHIKRLRDQVICDDFEIITVRGLGYKAVLK
jgi:two-component system, OmpR family, response regulator